MQKEWTVTEEKQLRTLWRNIRLSAADIGAILGRTRNSVLGKITRLGLHNRCALNINRARRLWRIRASER
jgi:hypothetical protein